MSEAIAYKIQLENLAKHLLDIECTILYPNEDGQIIYLPNWIPGSYLIRDLAKNIISIRATNASGEVILEKISKNTWRCEPCTGPLTISYQVYCFDTAPRGAYVDQYRVFFDGARIFLAVDGEEEQTRSVEIIRPKGAGYKNWRCISSMQTLKLQADGFGKYTAENHLELIDHPFEISPFHSFDFMVGQTPHTLVITGNPGVADWPRLVDDLRRICIGHVEFFGELPSMPRYIFILNVMGKGYGGLEHRSSCSLLCSRADLPQINAEEMSEEYRSLLGLFSHEYFHLWNVKRIRPEVFINPDLNFEAYTRQLWIFEGITSYFDNLNLVRNQIISPREYLQIIQKDFTSLRQNPGANLQTLEESSFDAWIKFYQPDENSINSTVSYYLKGSLVGLALDLLIIKNSQRRQSLADIMQVLWQQYGHTGLGLPENYFEKITFEVTGEDYGQFFDLALRDCQELPLAELLLDFGILYKTKAGTILDDVGIKLLSDQSKLLVKSILNNSAAEHAGLAANDIIIAINTIAVNPNNIEAVLKRYNAEKELVLHVFRNDVLIELIMPTTESRHTVCELEFAFNPGQQQTLNQKKWLATS